MQPLYSGIHCLCGDLWETGTGLGPSMFHHERERNVKFRFSPRVFWQLIAVGRKGVIAFRGAATASSVVPASGKALTRVGGDLLRRRFQKDIKRISGVGVR